jgi:hypothetical protein
MRRRGHTDDSADAPELFWAYLLCAPSWTLVAYCAALVLFAKLSHYSMGDLLEYWATMLPTVLVIVSPLCWVAAVLVSYVHFRRTRTNSRLASTVVVISGAVMATSWTILLRLSH